MRELAPELTTEFGIDLEGLPLLQVYSVSLDSRIIVGGGIDRDTPTWMARLGHDW